MVAKVSKRAPVSETHPELVGQTEGDLAGVTGGSDKKFTWRCEKDHEWVAAVKVRARGAGCPYCKGVKVLAGFNDLATTHPEIAAQCTEDPTSFMAGSDRKVVWRCSDGHEWESPAYVRLASGCPYCSGRFPIVGVTDLATTHPHLVVEALFDTTTVMAGTGKKVGWRCSQGHEWSAPVYSRTTKHSGCPMCAGQKVITGENDLATIHPELAAEALFDATQVMWGSKQKLPWRCALGHEWSAVVHSRVTNKRSCPYCTNQKVLAGFNDLATTHPEIAREALFDPTTVIGGNNKKKNWRCPQAHTWMTPPNSRTSDRTGCPSCANTGYDPNELGYLYLLDHPEWQVTQVGITNVPKNRVGKHVSRGWVVRDVRGPMDGDLARHWETDILCYVKTLGVSLKPESTGGNFSGFTEAWWTADFHVDNLKALMDLVDATDQ